MPLPDSCMQLFHFTASFFVLWVKLLVNFCKKSKGKSTCPQLQLIFSLLGKDQFFLYFYVTLFLMCNPAEFWDFPVIHCDTQKSGPGTCSNLPTHLWWMCLEREVNWSRAWFTRPWDHKWWRLLTKPHLFTMNIQKMSPLQTNLYCNSDNSEVHRSTVFVITNFNHLQLQPLVKDCESHSLHDASQAMISLSARGFSTVEGAQEVEQWPGFEVGETFGFIWCLFIPPSFFLQNKIVKSCVKVVLFQVTSKIASSKSTKVAF